MVARVVCPNRSFIEASSSTTMAATSASQNPLAGIKIYILQTKLSSDEIQNFIQIAESAGMSLLGDPESAQVIITAVRMRKRLERHISWETAVS